MRGFTLPEVLLTTAIIGTLASASVVSYGAVRSKARDTQRFVGIKQIQAALDLHLDKTGGFPFDTKLGPQGLILGEEGITTLSESGFGRTGSGDIFIQSMPANPTPFGTHFVYRSLNEDGTDCNAKSCAKYTILFAFEKEYEGLAAGPHMIAADGSITEPKGYLPEDLKIQGVTGSTSDLDRFDTFVSAAGETVVRTVNDPRVQRANEAVVAPSVAAATAANTLFAGSQFGQYLLLFLTQPASLLGGRRRRKWGTVYNSVTRMPVDLAIVRLRDTRTGKVIKSTVTDGDGRYSFLVPAGTFALEVAKAGLVFPSVIGGRKEEDGEYHDLYYGGALKAEEGGTVLTPNIPVDVSGVDPGDAAVVKADKKRRWHKSLALTSPVLGGIVFVMRPTVFVGLLFAAEILLYMLFQRMANPSEPKNWGTVYDKHTRRPVGRAVVRIFSAKYNKLLETQVTDAHGRYHFRVMGDVFYMTVTKPEYRKTETDPFDLRSATQPVVVASDLPLASVKSVPGPARAAAKAGGSPQQEAATDAPAPKQGGGLIKPAPQKPPISSHGALQTYDDAAKGGDGGTPALPESLMDRPAGPPEDGTKV